MSEKVNHWYASFKFNLQMKIREFLLMTAVDNLLCHDVEQLEQYMNI